MSTAATASSVVGSYPITVTGATDANYTITFVDGTLAVEKAPLTVAASNATRLYGAANPELTGGITGIVNGDNINASYSTTATPSSPVGGYEITSTLIDPDNKSGNYVVVQTGGTLAVTQASLTIRADDASRNFGAANPSFSATISGFVNSEGVSVLSGAAAMTTTATPGSLPGTYPITPTVGTLSSLNYAFPTFVNGTLTVLNTPPSAQSQSIALAEDSTKVVPLTGVDPEGSTLMFELKTPPVHGDLIGGLPNPTYIPHPNYHGSDSFVFSAHDGQFESEPATILIVVTPVEDAPTISSLGAQTMSKDSSLHLIFSVGDVDTALGSLVVTAQSSNGALVPNSSGALQLGGASSSRSIDITPAAGQTGTTTITLSVSDGAASASTSFELTASEGTSVSGFGGTALEGYIANGRVFFDANRNGVQEANEPGTQTDGQGHFNLAVPVTPFDQNQNGTLDAVEGRLVLTGGTDIATGLPLAGIMTAPLGATVVTPLTTVLEEMQRQNPALTGTQAEQLLMSALGVPSAVSSSVSLLRYDPFDASLIGDPKAAEIQAAAAKVYDTIAQTSALLHGASSQSPVQISAAVTQTLAAQVLAAGQLDLSAVSEVKALVTQSAAALNVTLPTEVINGAVAVVAEVNQAKDNILSAGLTSQEALAEITRVQHVAQAEIAPDLTAVGAGAVSIDDVVLSQTGDNLNDAIQAAPVGNLTGFDTRPGIISFSRAEFQVREGGVALEAVTLNRDHGTRGEIIALVLLSDVTATAASGDYTSGAIQVRFADGEISKAVDLVNRIATDGELEGNETIRLGVVLAAGALTGAAVGMQSSATLTVVDADSAGSFAFTQADFEVRENGSEPNTVTIARTGGTAGAVTVVVTPAPMAGGATPGVDYLPSPISVTFAAGAQYRRVTIPVVRDSQTEGNERFEAVLSLGAIAPAGATLGTQKTATVTILDVPNTAPTATARSMVVLEDSVLNLTLSGADQEGDTLTFAVVNSPSNGTLTGDSSHLSYRPHSNFNGSDSFTFAANDGLLDSAPATITITVNPVNDAPVLANPIADQAGTYGSAFAFTIPANAFTDIDAGQTLSFSASGLPPGITLDFTSRTLSGKPTLAGTFSVTITAADSGAPALSATANFSISIDKAPLSVTANNVARDYGQENPPLTGTLVGVVNNDKITATFSTAATATGPVGEYPIWPSLFDLKTKLSNYTVTTNHGTLTVRNVPPVVNAGPDQEKVAGDEVTFAGSFVDPSSPSHVAGWDFGDGSAPVIGTLTPKHVFTKRGVYTVKLAVTDSHLASASDTLIVTVISSYGSVSDALKRLKLFVKESRRIEKIVKDLAASLEPKYWLDEVHLNLKGGNKAFVYWRQSADMMEQLLKPSKKRANDAQDANDGEDDEEFKKIFSDPKSDTLSPAALKAVGLSLGDVIRASMLISETLYLESEGLQALDPRKQKRVDAALTRAKEYLEEANELVAKGDYGTAVRRYIRSWNNTHDAIDIAGQSQPAKELAKAQELIEESLDPKNWLDEFHLDLKSGAKTFNLMQSAARELANVVVDAQKGRVIAAIGQSAEAELVDLLARARAVSRTWYLENAQLVAVKPSNQKAVDSDLNRAREDLDKGLAAEAAGDSEKALSHYTNAWDATRNALEKAARN